MNNKFKKIFIFILFSVIVVMPQLSHAAFEPIMSQLPAACRDSGDCSLNDIVQMAVNLSDIIFGIIGSIVLLYFIYGGVVMLTSAGNKERVTKGKKIIVNSLIGLAVIFFSYSIIAFIGGILDVSDPIFTSK